MAKKKVPIKLGDTVRDTVTGHEGVVTGRTEWLTGCATISIQSAAVHDKMPVDAFWVDEVRVELVKPAKKPKKKSNVGGPKPTPQRQLAGNK